jgi:hypothetical protein
MTQFFFSLLHFSFSFLAVLSKLSRMEAPVHTYNSPTPLMVASPLTGSSNNLPTEGGVDAVGKFFKVCLVVFSLLLHLACVHASCDGVARFVAPGRAFATL